ncbi:MAG: UvrD-helicase domain-containing protein [Pseudomonadota bacterium]|nr:UvrD-helicase domain-containing protein [Pseudomonadota bacterium]
MKILEYSDLDISGVEPQYRKLIGMIEHGDFYSAETKKLTPSEYYRAKLDHSNRLLFTLRRHNGERYALILEVIRNHAYEHSRFLRGARIEEDKIPPFKPEDLNENTLPALAYVNPARARFHLLDKVISFDDAQDALFRLPPPLIVIGSAGSGKTALTLERMKLLQGEVLYVTLSPFLAQNARNLYYAHAYENEEQNIDFLSFQELLETLRVPAGREVTYGVFRGWFSRHRQHCKFADAHKLFEELKGVLSGADVETPYLSRAEYLDLGVRQSIFLPEERPLVYELFEKYLLYLKENGLFDSNLLAHQYLGLCQPRYDFAVVDEVQDLTNVQLALILRSLKGAGNFILCGDSNQIVHPNFFSWAKVKSLFYRDDALDAKRALHLLRTNYRNSQAITVIANRLLKVKQRRFGSIDRESNYLIDSVPGNTGSVELLPDTDTPIKDLDEKTRKSTRFAVLVMREEDKLRARERFRTPLLFAVHEAKGLEYENVILYNFLTHDRGSFNHVAAGVSAADLDADLAYVRAKDKADKSLEIYKFFVNSLYVALTRAVKNLYVIESDTRHALLQLMGLEDGRDRLDMAAQSSSLDEWQREARRLALHGKDEQAEAIRREILHARAVPWEVLVRERYLQTLDRAFNPKEVSTKPRQRLMEYGAVLGDSSLLGRLASAGYLQAEDGERLASRLRNKHLRSYEGKSFKDVLADADAYGVDFRTPFNLTPLMCAAIQGNAVLVKALLDKGANPDLTDNHGRTALHHALLRAYTTPDFASARLGDLYPLLAPASVSVKVQDRLVKIDGHTVEFFLFHSMVALLLRKIGEAAYVVAGFSTADFLEAIQAFPENVLPAYRKRRAYLSGVLARNEVARDYPYNRRIFVRLRQGYYALNPRLSLRVGEEWVDLYEHLGRPLLEAHGLPPVRFFFEQLAGASARSESANDPQRAGASPANPPSSPVGDRDLAHPASSQLDLFGD